MENEEATKQRATSAFPALRGPASGCGQAAVNIRREEMGAFKSDGLDLNSSFDIWLLLGKILNFSLPWFSYLQNEDNNTILPVGYENYIRL